MIVRYFCEVSARSTPWADMGYAYFRAIAQAGHGVRVLPIGAARPGDAVSRWSAHADSFMTPVPKEFLNVVCGDNGALAKYFTVGVKNMAITATIGRSKASDYDVTALALYDAVVCSTIEDAALLGARLIPAICVPPEADAIGRLLKGLE